MPSIKGLTRGRLSMQVTSNPALAWAGSLLTQHFCVFLHHLANLVNLMLCDLLCIASFVRFSLSSTQDIFRGSQCCLYSKAIFINGKYVHQFTRAKKGYATLHLGMA